jgi:ATP-dependent RNA helicase DDX27
MAMADDEELGGGGAVKAAIRSAKKAARPAKIGVPEKRTSKSKAKNTKSGVRRVTARAGGVFDRDLEQKGGTSGGRREGVRAKKGDAIGGMGKKGGKRKAK